MSFLHWINDSQLEANLCSPDPEILDNVWRHFRLPQHVGVDVLKDLWVQAEDAAKPPRTHRAASMARVIRSIMPTVPRLLCLD